MKKYLLYAMTLMACCFASCAEDELVNEKTFGKTFRGVIDQTPASRTFVEMYGANQGKVTWCQGDLVTINGVQYRATPDANDARFATFTKINPNDPEPDKDGDGLYVAKYGSFAIQQVEDNGSNCNAALRGESTDHTLHFQNVGALIKLRVRQAGVTIKRIFVGNYDVGNYAFDIPDGVDITQAQDFLVAIPEGTYTPFNIYFVSDDDMVCIAHTSKTFVRSHAYPIQILDNMVFIEPFETAYYTVGCESPTGAMPVSPNVATSSYCDHIFKLKFGSDYANAINFARGDVVEVAITADIDHYAYLLDMGGSNAWGSAGPTLNIVTNNPPYNNNVKLSLLGTTATGANLNGFSFPDALQHSMQLRLSKDCIERSTDGENWVTVITSEDPRLAELVHLGLEDPFYIGTYGNGQGGFDYPQVTFDSIKIRRSLIPEFLMRVKTITFDQTDMTLEYGGAGKQINATVAPVNATNKKIVWESDNTNIATVTQSGFVEPVGAGHCYIHARATDGSAVYATCLVSVLRDEDDWTPGHDKYFYRTGTIHNEARPFSIVDNEGWQISIPNINWEGGAELEVKITQDVYRHTANGGFVVIGNSTNSSGSPNIDLYSSGAGNIYGWVTLRQFDSGWTSTVGADAESAWVKINKTGFYFSKDGTNWTQLTDNKVEARPVNLQDFLSINPLIVGSPASDHMCTIQYIKLVEGSN